MSTMKTSIQKKKVSAPGRKISAREAREYVNRKFGPALAKLASK